MERASAGQVRELRFGEVATGERGSVAWCAPRFCCCLGAQRVCCCLELGESVVASGSDGADGEQWSGQATTKYENCASERQQHASGDALRGALDESAAALALGESAAASGNDVSDGGQ